jgi:uncharacterized protein (TIGR00369 family)
LLAETDREMPMAHELEPTMKDSADLLAKCRAVNSMAAFNRWFDIEVLEARRGEATITMPWREEAGQYSHFLHAGLIGALIDTACGFAAVTLNLQVLASHFSVNCLRPAIGGRFVARARVIKPGKSQVFTACELFSVNDGEEKLVATGETLLVVVNSDREVSA